MTVPNLATDDIINEAWVDAVMTDVNAIYGSWTAYAPAFTNVSGGVANAAYKLVGKTLHFRVQMTAGTATAAGTIGIGLPAGLTAAGIHLIPGHRSSAGLLIAFTNGAGATAVTVYQDHVGSNWAAGASLTFLRIAGTLEVQ